MTKTVQIGRSAAGGQAYIAEPTTMPQWALRDLDHGHWQMNTPRGKAILIPPYESTVTARVVPVGPSESAYIVTLPKPYDLPSEAFEAGMKQMDEELAVPEPMAMVQAVYEAFRPPGHAADIQPARPRWSPPVLHAIRLPRQLHRSRLSPSRRPFVASAPASSSVIRRCSKP